MNKQLLSLVFGMLILLPVHTQVQKLGKVKTSEVKQTSFEGDTSVHAAVLFDVGTARFVFLDRTIRSNFAGSNRGWQLEFERHQRIKIYDKSALDQGNFSIYLHKQTGSKEEFMGLKGFTFTMENGKVEKNKINMRDAYVTEVNEYTDKVTFAMPNVKAGTVIDVRYSILSDFLWSLRDWYFQRKDMPTLYSQYNIAIPEYFNYNVTMRGYESLAHTTDKYNNRLELRFIQAPEGAAQKGYEYTKEYNYQVTEYQYVGENIPAFKEDSYLTTPDNYLSRVNFELSYTKFPWKTMDYYTTTWENVSKTLMEDEDFGNRLDQGNFYSDKVELFNNMSASELDLMNMIYNDVQSNLRWNDVYSLYGDHPRKVYNSGEGDIGDINLTLIACLREAGLKAYPIVLSTRQHGIIMPAHPSINSFNYVVVQVDIDEDSYLLDATNPFACVNLLPPKCLNGEARLITDKTSSQWISLNAPDHHISSYSTVDFNKDSVIGKQQLKMEGYAHYMLSNEHSNAADSLEFLEYLENELIEGTINNYSLENINECNQTILLTTEVELNSYVQKAGDLVYFNPLFNFHIEKQPFKLEERKYPVEYPFTISKQHIFTIKLPDGYQIESIPEPTQVQLPDRKAHFIYTIKQIGNNIQVSCIMSINQQVFPGNEYNYLKQFYTMMVEKQKEQVVLKKL